ncbi:AMP-binding protein [Actinomadura graeca]|uniref:AMP-binding protein n=1 Tax=Actinomadura graeca TaxID=2750812 RepID=A0ABX8QNG7_9ACTN|nr:AMP-binding protein [Actinomadura graeca]QXJ20237.1 AMP-binding protein [Actinomadura graeca]
MVTETARTRPVFPQQVLDALRRNPGGPAFEHEGRVVSRGALLETIGRVAAAMRDAGLGPGSGVAVRTAVSPEAFAAHIAAHTLGCRVVGVRPGYPAAHLAHVLGMDVDAVVVDPSTAAPEPTRAGPVLSLGPVPGADDLLAHPGATAGAAPPAVLARPDDVALLAFTSGSTGRPKGCAFTYRALGAHWAWQPAAWSPVAAEMAAGFGRYLLFGTLASMVVFEFLGLCVLGGGTAVIPGEDGRPLFPDAIERYRITGSIVTVPRLCRMLDTLRDAPADVSSLRALLVSGSPIAPGRLAEAARRLGPVVYQGYGQTEAGSISLLTPADLASGPPGAAASVGRPHAGVEIAVRDAAGRGLGVGETGEIHVRGPYLMTGYWGRPEETCETLRGGWLATRDLGHVDADGYLHLTGRARDVIMVDAMVVYAGPVERVLAAHPDVMESYVVGAPDEETGEAVHAFVVPVPGRTPDRGDLAVRVRAELGAGSVPRTVTVVPSVPVAASGKPDKRALLRLL